MTDTSTWDQTISKAWCALVRANIHQHFDLHPVNCEIVTSAVVLRNRTRLWHDIEISHGAYALPAALRLILGAADNHSDRRPDMQWLSDVFPSSPVVWAWMAWLSYPKLVLISTEGRDAGVYDHTTRRFYTKNKPLGSRKSFLDGYRIETPQTFRDNMRAHTIDFTVLGIESWTPEFVLPRGAKILYSAEVGECCL